MARKENNIHYIYKTTCSVTGRWYVGMHSTTNLEDGYLGSGLRLRRSIRKYGEETHTKEILEYLPTREALILREIEIVTKELISESMCMNLKEGGQGGWFSDEVQLKCAKAGGKAKSEKMKIDEEFRDKVKSVLLENSKKAHKDGKKKYNNFEGKTHSEETKQLMRESMKGKGIGETNSQYGTCWMVKDGVAKKVSKEDLEAHLHDGWRTGRR